MLEFIAEHWAFIGLEICIVLIGVVGIAWMRETQRRIDRLEK